MPSITCPACGQVAQLPAVDRTSAAFCPTIGCDYPLFWAKPDESPDHDEGTEESLGLVVRRLPGVGGQQVAAPEPCPVCHEPNRQGAVFCRRCGANLHEPPPVPVFESPAAPEPPPEPASAPVPQLAPPPPPPEPRASPFADWRVIGTLVALAVVMMLAGSLVLLSRS